MDCFASTHKYVNNDHMVGGGMTSNPRAVPTSSFRLRKRLPRRPMDVPVTSSHELSVDAASGSCQGRAKPF